MCFGSPEVGIDKSIRPAAPKLFAVSPQEQPVAEEVHEVLKERGSFEPTWPASAAKSD